VDALVVRVPSVEAGLAFYRDRLGHPLLWRTSTAAGLVMDSSGTELVVSVDSGPETDVLVDSVDAAVAVIIDAGGALIAPPEDIAVGRVAVVADPFGNELTLVDLSKGRFETDAAGNVTGVMQPE
jgi:predicted enzyme related to lactoylglutathione lyase